MWVVVGCHSGNDSQYISQPINSCILYRIRLEKIMLHEFHTCQRRRVFLGPDRIPCLCDGRSTILDDELEFRVELAELDGESTCHCLLV